MQLLGQLCRLLCRHLSKSVFVHRLVSFKHDDKQCVGFIPDIYKLLDKYWMVGYILTFLKDALFPSKSVWRAILRQHVLQSNTQTMKNKLMYNGNEWLSPNGVDTNIVSNLWSICRNSLSLSVVCSKLLRIFALFISRLYVRQFQKCLLRTENMDVHLLCCCPRTNYEHLWTSVINYMRYREYGKWIHKSPSDQCKVMLGLAVSNNGVSFDNMSLSFLLC